MKDCPYLERRGARWFFHLGKRRALKAGWLWAAADGVPARRIGQPKGSIPLGAAETREEIAAVRARAGALYRDFLIASGAAPEEPAGAQDSYPPASLGAWFFAWRGGGFFDWERKKARTREDYERAWAHLGPALGSRPIHKIAANEFAGRQKEWEETLSPSERFRVVKCARAIFAAAERHKIIAKGSSPATALPNSMPAGRSVYVVAARVAEWAREARRQNKPGLSLIIRTAWEGAQAPVDIRTLTLAMLHRDGAGLYFRRARSKSRAELYIALSAPLAADIEAYVVHLREKLKIELTPNAPVFRKQRGSIYGDRRQLSLDFARVRTKVDDEDKAQLQDVRRSANLEMRLADAAPEDRATILANTLHKSKFLDATYTPPTLALARKMAEKREIGRALLAGAGNKVQTRRSGESKESKSAETANCKPLKSWRE